MFSIFTVAFFCLSVALLFTVLGALTKTVGFNSFYKVGAAFLVLFLALCINWGPSNQERKRFTGKYLIDTSISGSPYPELNKYSDLTLTVKKDLSFELSKPSPFFVSTTGTWNYDDRADYQILSYKFSGSGVEHEDFTPDSSKWELETTNFKGTPITFKRMRE
jgi:hypothetical protein